MILKQELYQSYIKGPAGAIEKKPIENFAEKKIQQMLVIFGKFTYTYNEEWRYG